jgi:hypothetical protein
MSEVSRVAINSPAVMATTASPLEKATAAGVSPEFVNAAFVPGTNLNFTQVDTRFPFSPINRLELVEARPIKDFVVQKNSDLAGAGEIDRLMNEASDILKNPNSTLEDKLIAQQKMSQAMTLFQFFSGIIKQRGDMEQTATRNIGG